MKSVSISAFKGLLTLFLCSSFIVNAQKKYFIYIQAEEKQPFYITINNKNFSSSVNGHLVIPRLKSGKYFFTAGFPKEKYPEQKFTCVVADKDQGFVLKQYGKDGWGLFNLITFTSTMANAADWEKDKAVNDTTKIDDDYTIVPSKTNESKPVVTSKTSETKEVKPDTEKPKDSSVSTTNTAATESTKATIVRTYQKGGAQGVDEVYVDYSATPKDTIVIFIPKEFTKASTEIVTPKNNPQVADTSKNKNPGKASEYNTSCVQMATDNDFAKTRKLMSLETTDDLMIVSAKKSFSNKCYYVEQIKNLGLLFISEKSRLKFFTMAKPFIYDRLNYASLETQFSLSASIDQFRKTLF